MSGRSPKVSQVWIDLDGDGTYSAQEKFNLSADSSDSNPADGKVYSTSIDLTIPDNYRGDGRINYRFYFEDADSSPVAGNANLSENFSDKSSPGDFYRRNQLSNFGCLSQNRYAQVLLLNFGYFTCTALRIRQIGRTNENFLKPDTAQLWITLDQNEDYQAGDKYDLTEVDPNDHTYSDGKKYSYKFTRNAERHVSLSVLL